MKKAAAVIVPAVLVASLALGVGLSNTPPPPPSHPFTVPLTIMAPTPHAFAPVSAGVEETGSPAPPAPGNAPDICGGTPDMTTVLQKFFKNIPDNSTVVFPQNACYVVDNGIIWQNLNPNTAQNITIDGNGAVFNQWPPAPTCGSPTCDSQVPILFLAQLNHVTIEDLNIQGAWDGFPGMGGPCQCGHGEFYEGKVGIMMQGNTNLTITDSTVQGTQGDGFSLQLPSGTGSGFLSGDPLNQGIIISNDSFINMGYTFTVEAADGVDVVASTFNNYQQIDFEVDEAGSGFHCVTCTTPFFAAQNNISFTNDSFTGFNLFWWTSLQGTAVPTPGYTFSPTAVNGSTQMTLNTANTNFPNVNGGDIVTGAGTGTLGSTTVSHVNQTTGVVTISGASSSFTAGPGQGTCNSSPNTAGCYTFANPTCQGGTNACLPAGCIGTQCTAWWGVQQYNVTFSGNTIHCGNTQNNGCQLVQVIGTPGTVLPNKYLNIGLTFTGNTLKGVALATAGGSCGANYGSMMTFKNVSRILISGNTFHAVMFKGCPGGNNIAAMAAVQANHVNSLQIKNNDFTGALDSLNTALSNNNTGVIRCGNILGSTGQNSDPAC